jgi:hypothetical protein
MDFSGSRHIPVSGLCEHGNEPLCFVKSDEFLD